MAAAAALSSGAGCVETVVDLVDALVLAVESEAESKRVSGLAEAEAEVEGSVESRDLYQPQAAPMPARAAWPNWA